MKLLNCNRMKLVVVGIVAAIVLSGVNVRADFTFGEATNLGPAVNSAANEGPGAISSDGLELYFWDCYFPRPGGFGGWDIWVTQRSAVSEPWGEALNLGPLINTEYDDAKPSISADGLTLYFCSNRPGGYGGLDLWMSTRATITDDWRAPVNLGEPVNGEADEAFPCVSTDGLELYFDSGRPGGYGDWDLWVAKRATPDDPWGKPVNLGEAINTPYYDSSPYLSPDGRLLFFHGYRPGGPSVLNMWVTTRKTTSDTWGSSMPLPVPPNSRYMDGIAVISADGFTFYCCSFRRGGSGMGDTWQAPIMPIVDFNGDTIADLQDLLMLIEAWGTGETLYDIGPMPWGDGIVDEADLNVLMSHWGQEVHYPAKRASLPTPFDQCVSDVEQAWFLSWWPGSDASEHDVYVGMDPIAVENADTSDTTGVYRGRQQASAYTLPEDVLPGQTFYWRIDEQSAANGTLTKGDLWSFCVADYLIVDGMEARDGPMWDIWWDGWMDPNNGGSSVWYPEADIVHGGAQCLFLTYDNSTAPISQVQRVWETPQDWTRKGVEVLALWVYGNPDNAVDPLYVGLQDSTGKSAMVTHPDSSMVTKNTWQEWRITLSDFAGVNLTAIKKMSIGVGDRGDTQPGGFGMLYIDDIYLHPVSTQGQ